MAASQVGVEGWQKKVLCRFFATGLCRAGDECPYGHDRSLSNKGTLPCKYFSRGTCANGDTCKFSHNSSSSTRNNDDDDKVLSNRLQATFIQEKQQPFKIDTSWAEAPEFVPRQGPPQLKAAALEFVPRLGPQAKGLTQMVHKSDKIEDGEENKSKTWAEIVNPYGAIDMASTTLSVPAKDLSVEDAESQLCPFSMMGGCRYGDNCAYVHGLMCDMCGRNILHPEHQAQRRNHSKGCMEHHEAAMVHSFAVAKSKDKTCGICMEVIMDKPKGEARFGIMPNCNHCYCLTCLRKWRQAKQFEHKIIRACPECRQTSDYICPSRYWVDTKEEKEKLLSDYKVALHSKECKYFRRGEGECPFGNKCFYRHASADGIDVDVGPPQRVRRQNADGEQTLVDRLLLYDFLEERDGRLVFPLEYLDFLEFLSDSEDSEWSEYELV